MSGEEELYVVGQDGSKPPTQMTTGGTGMRYQPEWSADGKRLAFSDKDGKVYVVTVADKKMTEIVKTPRNQIRDYAWSPSGSYLAFSMSVRPSGFASLYIWNAADNKVSRVTDDMFNAAVRYGTRRATISTSPASVSSRRRFRTSNSTTRPTAMSIFMRWLCAKT